MSLNKKAALIFVSLFLCLFATKAEALAGASFSLSPSTGVCIPGGTFDLNIILQSDEPASGATAIINYDPTILEAEKPIVGDIFPTLLARSVSSSEGRVRLDMGVEVGEPSFFTGSGTFGTIKFKVLQVGSASLSFDFTAGNTKDSNVAHSETHGDILTSASGGSYTFEEDNTDPSLDPSCVPSGGDGTTTPTSTPTPTPTPTESASSGPTPTPVGGGGSPEGGTLEPTVFVSLLSILMIGAGLILR